MDPIRVVWMVLARDDWDGFWQSGRELLALTTTSELVEVLNGETT